MNFHEQLLTSIEKNLGALVEAQQKPEQRMAALDERVDRLAAISEAHEDRSDGLERMLGSLLEVSHSTMGILQQMIQRVDHLALHQEQADQRIDRLAESVQRFLDSQGRRNGGD